MSVAEIQQAIEKIKELPTEERISVSTWAMTELEPEGIYARFDQALAEGEFDKVRQETDEEYLAGRVLSRLY